MSFSIERSIDERIGSTLFRYSEVRGYGVSAAFSIAVSAKSSATAPRKRSTSHSVQQITTLATFALSAHIMQPTAVYPVSLMTDFLSLLVRIIQLQQGWKLPDSEMEHYTLSGTNESAKPLIREAENAFASMSSEDFRKLYGPKEIDYGTNGDHPIHNVRATTNVNNLVIAMMGHPIRPENLRESGFIDDIKRIIRPELPGCWPRVQRRRSLCHRLADLRSTAVDIVDDAPHLALPLLPCGTTLLLFAVVPSFVFQECTYQGRKYNRSLAWVNQRQSETRAWFVERYLAYRKVTGQGDFVGDLHKAVEQFEHYVQDAIDCAVEYHLIGSLSSPPTTERHEES